MLPFIEVSHLPSSSSFYSAITQPLGLRYISAGDSGSSGTPGQPGGSPTLTYGSAVASPPTPVFELRQVSPAIRPLKRSRVVLSASSPDAIGQFRALVQRSKAQDCRACAFDDQALNTLVYPTDKAVETDLDGNMMEVVYVPPPGYPEGYAGATVRKTQSSQNEASRILNWNYNVVVSEPSSSTVLMRRSDRYAEDDMGPVVRRSVTSTTTLVEPLDSSLASPRQDSTGSYSTSTVVGTLLGVAAAGAAIGAGVAYGVMKNDRPRHDPYEAGPPPFQRRSTFPSEPYHGEGGGSRYSEYGPPADKDYRGGGAAPSLMSRHSYADDKASRLSSRFKPSPSAAPSRSQQLLLTDAEYRSQASSRHSARTQDLEDMVAADYKSHASTSRRTSASAAPRSQYAPSISRSHTYDAGADGGAAASYVSARSHKTASTVRPAAPQRQYTEPMAMSVSGSRPASKAPSAVPRSYVSARDVAPAPSRAGTSSRISARDLSSGGSHAPGAGGSSRSRVSARDIGLPRSGIGSSHAGWDRPDDLDSIAPSDSISCVGSRRSERMYH